MLYSENRNGLSLAVVSLAITIMGTMIAFPNTVLAGQKATGATLVNKIEDRLPEAQKSDLPAPPALRDGTPEAPPLTAPQPSTPPGFVLTGVHLSGAEAIAPAELAPIYDRYLAQRITIDEISKLIEEITAYYHQKGYFLSRAIAPAQSGAGGVLRIEIIEGYIDRVTIKGKAKHARIVKAILNNVRSKRPLKRQHIERAFALITRLSGLQITKTELQPDLNDFARHHLIVTFGHDRVGGQLYFDNRGTRDAGPLEVSLRGHVNSVLRWGDRLEATIFTTPQDPHELMLGRLSYRLPLHKSGTSMTVSGTVSRFDAGADLSALDVESMRKVIKLRFTQPLVLNKNTSLETYVGIKGVNIKQERLGAMTYEDKLRVVEAGLQWQHKHANGTSRAAITIAHGLDILEAATANSASSRPDADGQFTKAEISLSRYQNIGKNFGLFGIVAGQYSFDPLLSSEEFSLGGARFGRAFNYSEISGESGFGTSVEVRYGRAPTIPVLKFYQLYAFADYGAVWNRNLPDGTPPLELASAGGGLRFTLAEQININLEAARPLDRVPFRQDDKDWQGFFAISKRF